MARIRNNQRRSRARRNEHMRNLEEQLREYELRGVQASSSLQTAARSVVWENSRLRSLLRWKGVKDAEVESYLKFDMHDSDDGASDGLSARSILSSYTQSACGQEHLTASSSNTSHQKPMMELTQRDSTCMDQPPKSPCALTAQGDVDCPQLSTCPGTNKDRLIESQRSPSQDTLCLHSSTDRLEKGKRAQNNMTPCMEAAMIIVSMNNGSLSMEEANAELGCTPVNDCYVDNLTVFRVMDR